MARNIKDDEERNRRVVMVAEHIAQTGDSTRKTAEFFTETYFPISNATVHDYINRAQKLAEVSPEVLDLLRKNVLANTEVTVNDPEVLERVEKSVELFKAGLTIQEIADSFGVKFWTSYRDLNYRLQKVDMNTYKEVVEPRLKSNSLNNLKR